CNIAPVIPALSPLNDLPSTAMLAVQRRHLLTDAALLVLSPTATVKPHDNIRPRQRMAERAFCLPRVQASEPLASTSVLAVRPNLQMVRVHTPTVSAQVDRKSTRLN